MANLLDIFFSPPTLEDEERTREARKFFQVAWGVFIRTMMLLTIAYVQQTAMRRALISVVSIDVLCLVLLAINHFGWTRTASWTLIGGMMFRVTQLALVQGGLRTPGMSQFILYVLMAGLLLGERASLITAGTGMLVAVGLMTADLLGKLPPPAPLTVESLVLLNTIYIAVSAVLARMSTRGIRGALQETQVELSQRRKAEYKLELAISAGEVAVWERDLSKDFFYGSERAFATLGLPLPKDGTIAIADWVEIVHPEDRERAVAALKELEAGADRASVSYRIRWPDGQIRHMEAAGAAIKNKAGATEQIVGMFRDVTQRKLAEQEREGLLHDYSERIKELTTLKKASALLLDPRLDTPRVLKGVAELLPEAFQYPEITRASLRFGSHAASTPGFKETPWLRRQKFSTRDGVSGVIEIVYLEERPHAAEGAFLAEEGHLLETLAQMLTTSLESRSADQKVHAQERRFRALIENIGDGIALVDAAGVVTYDSDLTGKVLGYPDGQFVGATVRDAAHPDDQPTLQAAIRRAYSDPDLLVPIEPMRYRHKNGSWVWVEGTVRNRLADPDVGGLVMSYRDVSPRMEAQKALVASEERYRNIIETSEEGILLVGKDALILLANPKVCSMSGYAERELIGRRASDLLFPEDVAELMARRERRKALGTVEQYDQRLRRKDGSPVFVLTSASVLRDGKGEFAGSLYLMTDMTARNRLQGELLQSQKIEAMGRLSGGIAHDFNNLLTAILGFSHLLKQSFEASDPRHEDVDEITATARRAAELTKQLLAFSRKQVLEPTTLNLNDTVVHMEKMLKRLIGEEITFELKLDPALEWCKADSGQAEQVFLNLVVNARDAMPKGGRITIASGNARLDASEAGDLGLAAGAYVRVSVADTGEGMSEETQRRIFEPFFTTKPQGVGTGLGLSTVFGIVKQSGGGIRVRSTPGAGAAFEIFFPAVAKPKAAAAAAAQTVRAGNETLLLVDDDRSIRGVARRVLTGAGYQVIEADGARAALEVLKKEGHRVQLLITDVVMPEMGGFELAKEAHVLRPSLRVLFVSGYLDREAPEAIPGLKYTYLQKPFSAEVLSAKVRAGLDAP